MIASKDRHTIITHDFTRGHEYEVTVRAIGPDGTMQAMESAARNTIVLTGKLNTPSAPSSLTITGFINSVRLAWVNPTNYDLSHVEIWRASVNDINSATKIAETMGVTYIDVIGNPNITRYYWMRAVNTSTISSYFHPDTTEGVSGTTLGVEATDIGDFSVTATKMFNNTIILTGDSWTDNYDAPANTEIAWNAHTIVYQGASHSIAAGNTANQYVYWDGLSSSYDTSASQPNLSGGGFMIAVNRSGIHELVWNSSANMIIGTAWIADLAVTNAKINDLSASKLTAGTIDASVITVTNLDAGNITTGTLTGRTVQTSGSGGRIVLDPTAGVGLECYDGSNNLRFYVRIGGANDGDVYCGKGSAGWMWDNSAETMTVRGGLNADDLTTGTLDASVVTVDNLTATMIEAGTLTGSTVQTASSGQRVILSQADNTLKMYRGAEASPCVLLDDEGGLGPRLHLEGIASPYGGAIQVGDEAKQYVYIRHDYMTIDSAVEAVPLLTLTAQSATTANLIQGVDHTPAVTFFVTPAGLVAAAVGFRVAGNQVVGAQGAAVADATGAGDVVAQLNALLARCRAHGLIAT